MQIIVQIQRNNLFNISFKKYIYVYLIIDIITEYKIVSN